MRKIKMPKTKAQFEAVLINTFLAGCNHGYGVDHSVNVYEQEVLGAEYWVGRISKEELYERWDKLIEI
jgi:hypothetical protein